MTEPVGSQLPRGRHRLSRAEVVASQRLRMVAAMAEAMAEKGYVGTSVADVITRAGVSRETFYQLFSSKLDCFMAAFDTAGEVLLARLDAAVGPGGSRLERFETGFAAYLDALAVESAYARMFLVEVHAAGGPALERRAAFQRRVVDLLADLLDVGSEHGRFACEMLVAGVGALVTGPLVARDHAALERLHAPVVDLVRRALAVDAGPADR